MFKMNERVYNQQSQSASVTHQVSMFHPQLSQVIHPQSSQVPTLSLQSPADLLQVDSGLVQNSAWFKEKMLLAQVQEAGIALSKEQLAILADIGDRVDSLLGAYSLTTNPIF
ncbi:hypothetical protein Tco_1339857 [Tanacetum coccineum]